MKMKTQIRDVRRSFMWPRPESLLKKKIKRNPIHPFTEADDRYVYEPSLYHLYLNGMIFFLSFSSGCIYWYILQSFGNDVFDTTFILLTLWSVSRVINFWHQRRIEIEKDGQNYFFYLGDKLQYKGEIPQIYIRLKGAKSSNGNYYFTIVLNGYRMEEQQLVNLTTNKSELEDLAKKMAFRLNINYFDWADVSNKHQIRHRDMSTEMSILQRVITPPARSLVPNRRKTLTGLTLDAFY